MGPPPLKERPCEDLPLYFFCHSYSSLFWMNSFTLAVPFRRIISRPRHSVVVMCPACLCPYRGRGGGTGFLCPDRRTFFSSGLNTHFFPLLWFIFTSMVYTKLARYRPVPEWPWAPQAASWYHSVWPRMRSSAGLESRLRARNRRCAAMVQSPGPSKENIGTILMQNTGGI